MMQNKLHLYVQDAFALNGLEAGRSCFDDFQHQKALRPLADGSRSAKNSTRSQCQFGCENDTSDGSSEICIIRWSRDRWAGLRSIFHLHLMIFYEQNVWVSTPSIKCTTSFITDIPDSKWKNGKYIGNIDCQCTMSLVTDILVQKRQIGSHACMTFSAKMSMKHGVVTFPSKWKWCTVSWRFEMKCHGARCHDLFS